MLPGERGSASALAEASVRVGKRVGKNEDEWEVR